MGTVFTVFELVGTVAFAISGAIEGIHKRMDLFGVMMLGMVTAVGGGVIRDVIIGKTPPAAFRDPSCALLSLAVSGVVFFAFYFLSQRCLSEKMLIFMNELLFLADTAGLAAFTVLGIEATLRFRAHSNSAVLLFVGVTTGVGGGILRDLLSDSIPYVFRKHIYALASILGAGCMLVLLKYYSMESAALFGALVVIVIRIMAARFKWDLPRIKTEVR